MKKTKPWNGHGFHRSRHHPLKGAVPDSLESCKLTWRFEVSLGVPAAIHQLNHEKTLVPTVGNPCFMGFWKWSPHNSLVVHITGQFTLFIIISLVVQFQAIWKYAEVKLEIFPEGLGFKFWGPQPPKLLPRFSSCIHTRFSLPHNPSSLFWRVNPCSPPVLSHPWDPHGRPPGKNSNWGRQKMKISITGNLRKDVPLDGSQDGSMVS